MEESGRNSTNVSPYTDLKYELKRLSTFHNRPASCSQFSTRLARVGFCYRGNGDEVICYVCGIRVSNWKDFDEPDIVHKQLSPDCAFFSPLSDNVPINRNYVDEEESDIIRRLACLGLENENAESQDPDRATIFDGSSAASARSKTPARQHFPKSKSADQIKDKTAAKGPGHLSLITYSNTSQIVRSTSYSSGSFGQNGRNQSRDGNVPDVSTSDESRLSVGGNTIYIGSKSFDLSKLRYEKNRLDTYKKWPSHIKVPPQSLAKSGFFYTGVADRVMCVFCKGALRNWDEGDQPNFEHRKHFPKCRHILGLEVGNVPMAAVPKTPEQLKNGQNVKEVNCIKTDTASLGNLGIITEKPKHPRYSTHSERLATFVGWPVTKHQTPEQLAEAGFFYAGFDDNVKCFYCNGGLRNWEPGDKPWVEHAKWFKKCPFIKQVKGEDFIRQTQGAAAAGSDEPMSQLNAPEVPNDTRPTTPHQHLLKRRKPLESDQDGLDRVEEREIRARLDSSMAMVVEKTGVSRDVLSRVIRKRLVEKGDDFLSASELLSAVYELEEENLPEPDESAENQAESENEVESETTRDPDKQDVSDDEAAGSNEPQSEVNILPRTEADDITAVVDDKAEDNYHTAAISEKSAETKRTVDDLEKENQDLKEQRLCKICMVHDSSIVFVPCGHFVSCPACSPALNICPICRVPIKGFVRTFIA